MSGFNSSRVPPAISTDLEDLDIVYAGIFLYSEVRQRLLDWWEDNTSIPVLERVWLNHVTIRFRPDNETINALPMGSLVYMKVTGWAADPKGQAMSVDLTDVEIKEHPLLSIDCPHLTISTDKETRPFYSKELLRSVDQDLLTIPDGPVFHGRVGVYTSTGEVLYRLPTQGETR